MLNPKLISLNALRAFSVAGKHLNLAAAAGELFVTPSALSHQIRALEEALGMQLFERHRKGLKLTIQGERLFGPVSAAFEQIEQALIQLARPQREGSLHISMLSTFAMRWFIPRLARFQQQHPELDVRISTSVTPVDFEREDMDCAIRFGSGDWPGLVATELFSERLAPFCSPNLATADIPLTAPSDLMHHRLLSARLRPDDWRIWLSASGLDKLATQPPVEYETRNFAIQAAIDGLGVVIVDPVLVTEEIKSGRLIQPFAQIPTSQGAYYFAYPERIKDSPGIRAMKQWLLKESSGTNTM